MDALLGLTTLLSRHVDAQRVSLSGYSAINGSRYIEHFICFASGQCLCTCLCKRVIKIIFPNKVLKAKWNKTRWVVKSKPFLKKNTSLRASVAFCCWNCQTVLKYQDEDSTVSFVFSVWLMPWGNFDNPSNHIKWNRADLSVYSAFQPSRCYR